MNKKTYTLAELVELSVPYFAANSDVPALLATTHAGKFYRPEFESYANHAVAKAGEGEVVVIYREALLVPEGMTVREALAEDGVVVSPTVNVVAWQAPTAPAPAPSPLAELVASATRFSFPAPAEVPSSAPVTAEAPAPAAKRVYKPRAPKAAPAPKTEATPATATKKKASTKSPK